MSLDCNNDSDLNGMDKRDLVVMIMAGTNVYNCYTRRFFRSLIKSEFEKNLYESSMQSAPLIKEPYFSVLIDRSLIAFQHSDCFVIYKRTTLDGEDDIVTVRGVPRQIYSVHPVSLEKFITRPGTVAEFAQSVVDSISSEEANLRIRTDIDFILRGGDIDFIGPVYTEYTNRAIEQGKEIDYRQVERDAEAQEDREIMQGAVRLGPRMNQEQANRQMEAPPGQRPLAPFAPAPPGGHRIQEAPLDYDALRNLALPVGPYGPRGPFAPRGPF